MTLLHENGKLQEPTSGLDARAAAIVMRTVRNTVNTGVHYPFFLPLIRSAARHCTVPVGRPYHPRRPVTDPCPLCAGRTVVCTIHQPSIDIFEVCISSPICASCPDVLCFLKISCLATIKPSAEHAGFMLTAACFQKRPHWKAFGLLAKHCLCSINADRQVAR